MSYDKEIYDEVSRLFALKRSRSKNRLRARKQEVYSKLPRIKTIESELSGLGISVARAVLSGSKDVTLLIEGLRQRSLSLRREQELLLASAGFDKNYLFPEVECDTCLDEGYVDGKMCACFKKALGKALYGKLNSRSPLSLASFETFKLSFYPEEKEPGTHVTQRDRMREIFGYCKSYAKDLCPDSPSLYMTGATGLGKTHLSLAIAGAAIEKGMNVLYNSWQNLLSDLEREKFGQSEIDAGGDTMSALLSCDLLILDDVGTEFQNSFGVSALYHVINTRMNAKKPTIISSNLTPKEIRERYGERVMSRLTGEYILLRFAGNDIRQILCSIDAG